MGKSRTRLLAVVGLGIGVVTLRAIRKRRTTPEEEAKAASEEAREEAEAAADHAAAAVEHARVAGEKAIESAREELEATDIEVGSGEESTAESGRLPRVRKS